MHTIAFLILSLGFVGLALFCLVVTLTAAVPMALGFLLEFLSIAAAFYCLRQAELCVSRS